MILIKDQNINPFESFFIFFFFWAHNFVKTTPTCILYHNKTLAVNIDRTDERVSTDFPGLCFASTKCATVEPGHTWELSPFCGRSTCVQGEGTDRLLELVEDCGPYPKANPKCKLSEKTNKTAAFPECCPVFECEPGVKLEYPEITVIENSESSEGGSAAPATGSSTTSTTTEKSKA